MRVKRFAHTAVIMSIPRYAETTHMRPLDRSAAIPLDYWADGCAPVRRQATGPRNDVKTSSLQLSTISPQERGYIADNPMRMTPQPGDVPKPRERTLAAQVYANQFSSAGTAHVTDGPAGMPSARYLSEGGMHALHVPAHQLSERGMQDQHGHFAPGQQNADPSGRLTPTGAVDRVLDFDYTRPTRRVDFGTASPISAVPLPPSPQQHSRRTPSTHAPDPRTSQAAGGPPSTPGDFGGRGSRASEHIYYEGGVLRRNSREEHIPSTSHTQDALGSPQGRDFHSSLRGAAPFEDGPSSQQSERREVRASISDTRAHAPRNDSMPPTSPAGMQTPNNVDTDWNEGGTATPNSQRRRAGFTEPLGASEMPPLIGGPGPAVSTTPGRRRDQRDFDGASARSLISGGHSWGSPHSEQSFWS